MLNKILLVVACIWPVLSLAATYRCEVKSQTLVAGTLTEKLADAGLIVKDSTNAAVRLVSAETTRKSQAHLILEDEKVAFVERCSFVASVNKVTCDRYQIDQVVVDKNVDLKKFYLFKAQFDVQIFRDLSFIENNGRGGVAYGTCKLLRP
jgi:hypothetical protein